MADVEKVIKAMTICGTGKCEDELWNKCPYSGLERCAVAVVDDAIKLLKEQEAIVKQWTKEIADNQLAHAPKDSHEFMSLDEHLENEYKRGIWDGLQIAWNIISEGR